MLSLDLIVNSCNEHFLLISYGTQINNFVSRSIFGIGKDMLGKGSKVTDTLLQELSGHLTVLLNYPCIKSTIID